jgi:hypothetical protein
MSVVTAVPFGLGIRDALTRRPAVVPDVAAQQQREVEEYEAQARRDAIQRELKVAERMARLDQLFGAKPAEMGALFEGIELGANADTFQPDPVRRRIEKASRGGFLDVRFNTDATTLHAVWIVIEDSDDACNRLRSKLQAAWGDGEVWIDPATHQRAGLIAEPCTLTFDRYLEPEQLVAALPFDALGKQARALGGEIVERRVDVVLPGLGLGHGPTTVEANLDGNGRIKNIGVAGHGDAVALASLREAITKKLRTPAVEPNPAMAGGKAWVWRRSSGMVELHHSELGDFEIDIGDSSWP